MRKAVTMVVAEAVAAGAAATGLASSEQVVAGAYATLKTAIRQRYSSVDLEAVEQRPSSSHRRGVLAEALAYAGAAEDMVLLACAEALIAALRTGGDTPSMAVGVDLERVRAAALRIRDVRSSGGSVRVADADIGGEIDIGAVRAGRADPLVPSSARR